MEESFPRGGALVTSSKRKASTPKDRDIFKVNILEIRVFFTFLEIFKYIRNLLIPHRELIKVSYENIFEVCFIDMRNLGSKSVSYVNLHVMQYISN